jgi:hypothetical protein
MSIKETTAEEAITKWKQRLLEVKETGNCQGSGREKLFSSKFNIEEMEGYIKLMIEKIETDGI